QRCRVHSALHSFPTRRSSDLASLPLMVDADHGYGNALNVARCVQELESAGVSALSIEDTQLPLPFGAAGESYISVEEGAAKMRADRKSTRLNSSHLGISYAVF